MLYGVDVSHWNTEAAVKSVMEKTHIDFIVAKSSEGARYRDDSFKEWFDFSIREKLLFGAYHFYNSKKTPKENADNLIESVYSVCPDDYPVLLAFDVEGGHATKQVFDNDIITACIYVNSKIGVLPLVYTSSYNVQKMEKCREEDIGLWVAHYTTLKKPITYGYKNMWALWQYNNRPIDLDKFNGDRRAWFKYCGVHESEL